MIFSDNALCVFLYLNFNFLAVVQGPGLLEQLRETRGINLHQVSSNSEALGPSYNQKTD